MAPPRMIQPLGLAVSALVKGWMSTLDYKIAYYDPSIDPAVPFDDQPRLYLFWHEYIQFFLHLRPNCHMTMLLSRHRDADILAEIARRIGFGAVRGSTARSGSAAICQMMKNAKEKWLLTMTPDGPRGPRRKMAGGAVYLASRLGIDIIPLGVGYDRPWRLRSWDRFAIPRPGSRARLIAGPPVSIPSELDRQGIEHYTRRIEELMNRLCALAERWAEEGYEIKNAANLSPGPRRGVLYPAYPRASAVDEIPLEAREP
ncbi:MAG: lysophospholipid acyltransferase family protein [Thermoguttaceae bacterium]|nr:lysophospholipid acyltransferase family protein [Thermoguttaceae bacterium]MBR2585124.1 lysophospholipid acyltransferase family protein [Thermoguttaceae bacterium]